MIKKVIFLALFTAVVSGCTYRSAISTAELKATHNMIVIPYKGAPVGITSTAADQLDRWAGPIAGLIAKSATNDWKAEVVDYFDKISGAWDPSTVIAEECANVLRYSKNTSIHNIKVSSINILPGYDDLSLENRARFSTGYSGFKWQSMYREFGSSDQSLINFKKVNPKIDEDWALELFDIFTGFNDSQLYVNFYAKLSDTKTNRILATGWRMNSYDEITTKEKGSDFKTFEKLFRESAKKSCVTILTEMGLI